MPQIPVQRAVVHRFQNTVGINLLKPLQVRQGARHLEDAVVGAGAEVHLAHRVLQHGAAFGVELAVLLDEARRHAAVGVDAFAALEAIRLHGAGFFHTRTDLSGGFDRLGALQFLILHDWHLKMQINAVQQWSADSAAVLLHHDRRAAAGTADIAEEAALAWIHCQFSGR